MAAVLANMSVRPAGPGPFFMERDGQPLSWPALVSAGFDVFRFSGHSFRIGAATTAAQAGLSDSFMQTLGQWRSSTFLAYIRTPQAELASVTRQLLG